MYEALQGCIVHRKIHESAKAFGVDVDEQLLDKARRSYTLSIKIINSSVFQYMQSVETSLSTI
jgi:hypothetical protein